MFMKVTPPSNFDTAKHYFYDLAAWFTNRRLAKMNMEMLVRNELMEFQKSEELKQTQKRVKNLNTLWW